jgi:hypothetical protein
VFFGSFDSEREVADGVFGRQMRSSEKMMSFQELQIRVDESLTGSSELGRGFEAR